MASPAATTRRSPSLVAVPAVMSSAALPEAAPPALPPAGVHRPGPNGPAGEPSGVLPWIDTKQRRPRLSQTGDPLGTPAVQPPAGSGVVSGSGGPPRGVGGLPLR